MPKSEVAESYGKCIIILGESHQFSKLLVAFYTFNRAVRAPVDSLFASAFAF